MTQGPEGREPDEVDEVHDATAGEPAVSGTDATRDSMQSPEKFRLSEDELNERDERFSGPRKEQGPPLTEPDDTDAGAMDEAADSVPETDPPPAE
jgi:hypothetical protein